MGGCRLPRQAQGEDWSWRVPITFWRACDLHSLGTGSLQVFPKAMEKQRDSSLNTLVKDGGKMEGICFCPCLLPVVEAGRRPVLRHLEITILRKTNLFYSR